MKRNAMATLRFVSLNTIQKMKQMGFLAWNRMERNAKCQIEGNKQVNFKN